MYVDDVATLVHCGGYVTAGNKLTSDCFAFSVAYNGTVMAHPAAGMLLPLYSSCYGSDKGRFAVAGGLDLAGTSHSNVFVLDNLNSSWGSLDAELPTVQARAAGLLIGDVLLCLGGAEELVSQANQLCMLRPNSTTALSQSCGHCQSWRLWSIVL